MVESRGHTCVRVCGGYPVCVGIGWYIQYRTELLYRNLNASIFYFRGILSDQVTF